MAKSKAFYAIYVYDDCDFGGRLVGYCRTKAIAKRELKKYRDDWSDKAPTPDDYHIRKLEMIVD